MVSGRASLNRFEEPPATEGERLLVLSTIDSVSNYSLEAVIGIYTVSSLLPTMSLLPEIFASEESYMNASQICQFVQLTCRRSPGHQLCSPSFPARR
jgi:hypothetical protein